jgi:20S proteasome alpha/beta subunit
MTLCLAIIARENIVVATDGRATMNDPGGIAATSDTVKKILPLPGGCVLLAAGMADLMLPDESEYHEHEAKNPYQWAEILCSSARLRCQSIVQELKNTSMRPAVTGMIAGYTEGEPVLLTFSSTANFRVAEVREPFSALGSMGLAHYLLRRFHQATLNAQQAAALAYYCIHETSFQLPHVGGQTQIAFVRNGQPPRFAYARELQAYQQITIRLNLFQSSLLQLDTPLSSIYNHHALEEEERGEIRR